MPATIAILSLGLVTGCASQDRVVRMYQSESSGGPFRNVLVVGVYSDANARRDFETAFVRALRDAGVSARYSLEFIRSTDEIDRELLLRIAGEADADGVLISRPVTIDRQADFEEGRSTAAAERRNDIPLADFFRYDYAEYQDPMELTTVATVVLETDLYRVADETRVWQVQSTSIDKESVFEIVTDEARALTAALGQDGLIP